MNNKDILDEIGIDKVNAAIRYYVKMRDAGTPVLISRAANLFSVPPKRLATELQRKDIKLANPKVVMPVSEKKKKKKKIAGSVPCTTNAGYSGNGGLAGMSAAGGPAGGSGGASGGVGESAVSTTFDAKDINQMASLDLGSAKERAEAIINGNFSKPENKRKQLRSLSKARSTTDIMALLYNILLAGEGLGTVKARGKKDEGSCKRKGKSLTEEPGLAFGNWKAVVKTGAGQIPLEEFTLTQDDVIRLKTQELAKKHGVDARIITIYNVDDEEIHQESVINKINGAKKKVKRKVNITQRRPHEEKLPHEKL